MRKTLVGEFMRERYEGLREVERRLRIGCEALKGRFLIFPVSAWEERGGVFEKVGILQETRKSAPFTVRARQRIGDRSRLFVELFGGFADR